MKTGSYIQNMALLAFVLTMTFGIWYLNKTWHGAWSAVVLLAWLSPSGCKCKSEKRDSETQE